MGEEEIPLWPSGDDQGEFVPEGSMNIDRQPALRGELVCSKDDVTSFIVLP